MDMKSGARAIDKIFRRRDNYDIPDWQREDVWDDPRKRKLIDSVLRGWKLPKFYFLKTSDSPEEFEVVDGQQRLIALFEFFSDELDLTKKSADEFGGALYSELPQATQDKFDDFEIQFDVIENAEEKEYKEFFQRVQAGLPLTSSEKLNSVHSNLREFVKKLAKHPFFQSKVALNDKRYAHFDIAAKVAAIEIEGLNAGLRFDDLKATFEDQAGFSSKSQVGKRVQAGLDYLDRVFPSKNQALRNRSVIQSFATLAIKLAAAGKAAGSEARLRSFFEAFARELSRQVELGASATDLDYLTFQRTVNANVKSGARTRHEILLRKLLLSDPAAADLFDPTIIAESGVSSGIKRAGESVATLVHDVNSNYAAKHGVDLFKATNRTSLALTRLGKPIAGFEQYKTFIADIYFLLHEGAGSRLDGKKPQSLEDVPLLRTGLQHDVDHGTPSQTRAKLKKIGDTFKRYAGVSSPEGIDPSRFALVQAALLVAIERDLRALAP